MTGSAPPIRCGWVSSAPDYVAYHDEEWGRRVEGDDRVFERLTLEAFQSGLSWITILRKRENFRAAFAGFSIPAVAAFDQTDVDRLLGDAGIVRNRAKIEAAVANARAALDVGLSDLVWRHADPASPCRRPWRTCPPRPLAPRRSPRSSGRTASGSSAPPPPTR